MGKLNFWNFHNAKHDLPLLCKTVLDLYVVFLRALVFCRGLWIRWVKTGVRWRVLNVVEKTILSGVVPGGRPGRDH